SKIVTERRGLDRILGTVGDLARATYTSGGVDASLQVLLAEDPAEFLAQASALDQVAKGQADALRSSQTARLRLAQSEATLQQKQDAAQKVRNEMSSSKKEADARLNEAEGVLGTLSAAERQRLAAMAASERQASLASAHAAASSLSSSSTSGGGYSVSSRALAAVRYALDQVGDRYVAAAAGPSSFDCSGLTLAAWRQGGVSLPHYSYSQYTQSRKIPLSQAQPGDLVFYFGGSTHHVGLYIGHGKMVEAASPGRGVQVADILGPWYRERFSGIGRVVG
ncbi:MAG: NlpC/P60 family protein, partial [Actinomycetes bacterium]